MTENSSVPTDLRIRTRQFALRIVRLYISLPKNPQSQVIGKQVLRSGTSIGAQYAESVRAKSRADFVSKIEGALQELEETLYWFDLLADAEIIKPAKLEPLRKEANELISIFVVMAKRTKNNDRKG